MTPHLILHLIALVLVALAAIRLPSPPWFQVHWGWLGIAVWLLAMLV